MEDNIENKFSDKMAKLMKNLLLSKKVSTFDAGHEKQAETLSHGILDMDESFRRLSNELFPNLLKDGLKESDIDDLLFEIGEELKHILYHIDDMKYYSYISDR